MLFYIAGRSAFARDNKAAIAAFQREQCCRPAAWPEGMVAKDRFSLKGFARVSELKRLSPGRPPMNTGVACA